MANETTNIGLRKPVPTENFDIDRDFNANWDKLDIEVKGIKDAKDALEQEVITARGTEATLGARFDSTDAQRQQDQLRVAKVEKDINDYQSTMASVNVNQEAKQSVTGHGVVSLPKNTANGQVAVSVNGNTLTNALGDDGDCGSLSLWTNVGITVSTERALYGSKSFKLSPTSSTARAFKDFPNVEVNKYYLVFGSCFINSYTDGSVRISLRFTSS